MKHENMLAKYCRNLEIAIENVININSLENYSDTPDFILAKYLRRCLENFNETLQEREKYSAVGTKARVRDE